MLAAGQNIDRCCSWNRFGALRGIQKNAHNML